MGPVGYGIFGEGDTVDDCIHDEKQWPPNPEDADDVEVVNNICSAQDVTHGYLIIVPADVADELGY